MHSPHQIQVPIKSTNTALGETTSFVRVTPLD